MKKRNILAKIAGLTSIALVLAGCGNASGDQQESGEAVATASAQENTKTAEQVVSKVSYTKASGKEADCVITLNGSDAKCDGNGAAYAGGVVTISEAGCYEITGTLTDGRIEVNADKEDTVEILLNGVEVTCSDYAPFVVWQADKTLVYLVDGTDNKFCDGSSYTVVSGTTQEDTPTGAVFSKDDISFSGEGSLEVTASYKDGISGKDDVQFTGGSFKITASDDGIVGNDSIAVQNGTFAIEADGDGLKATTADDAEKGFVVIEDGTFAITAENDAIQAESYIWVADGTFQIEAGDDAVHADYEVCIAGGELTIAKSYEGLEGQIITITGGNIDLTASDDGINAADASSEEGMDGPGGNMGGQPGATSSSTGQLVIQGGNLTVNAGGDGLDSNGSITMSGGTVYVEGPVNDGNGILDYDTEFTISGGTLVGAGSSGMLQTLSDSSSQANLAVAFNSAQTAGTKVSVKDSDGKEVFSFTPAKSFSAVVLSSADLKVGETYDIYLDGASYASIEMTSTCTTSGNAGMGGGMGGQGSGQMNRRGSSMGRP